MVNNQNIMDGDIHTYKGNSKEHRPEANRGYKPKCYCKDFSSNVGNLKLACCTSCGRVWIGSGSPRRGGFMPTRMILDLDYLKKNFPKKFKN